MSHKTADTEDIKYKYVTKRQTATVKLGGGGGGNVFNGITAVSGKNVDRLVQMPPYF
jgi:hypothetical protein